MQFYNNWTWLFEVNANQSIYQTEDSKWVLKSSSIIQAPWNATRIKIHVGSNNNSTSEAYWDDNALKMHEINLRPVPPQAPIVVGSISNGKPQLNWNAVSGAVNYKVNRISWHPDVTSTVFTTSNNSFIDNSIPFNVQPLYLLENFIGYYVTAINNHNLESVHSNYVYYNDASGGWFSITDPNSSSINVQIDHLPEVVTLQTNYPNPFNPTTQIRFGLPEQSSIRMEVFNIMGQKVAMIANGTYSPGYHSITFDGSGLSSGIYITRLWVHSDSGDSQIRDIKMQLVK